MDIRFSDSSLNAFLDGLAPLRHTNTRFLLASAIVLAALVLTLGAEWIFGSTASVIFALTVIISTSLFGLTAGLCTAAAAALALDFFYLPPSFRFHFDFDTLRMAVPLLALAVCTHLVERRVSARIRSKVKVLIGIKGHLDGIANGEVYGWAFNPDAPSEPVLVTVFVNRRPVANVAAVHYRPDVEAIMHCSGRHGFYVDVTEHFPVETEVFIDVRLADGSRLPNVPRTIRGPAVPARPHRPTVLFMHIPKTAGTAFREAVAANFLQSEIAYLYPGPPGFLVSDLRALPLEQRRGYRIVIGHYQYGMHEALPQNSEYVTIVREPGARVLSQYAYARQTQPELVSESTRVLSLEEVLEKRLTVDFDNMMVRCFAGVDEREFPAGKLTRDHYDRAVHNFRTAFTFVGQQERSAQSYQWLQQHYGWYAMDGLPIVNVGPARPDKEPGPALAQAIRHYNQWDFLLYEEILRSRTNGA